MKTTSCVGLHTDHVARAEGVDPAGRPRFSWSIETPHPPLVQLASEVEVAANDGSLIWSSGRVHSSEPWLDYSGAVLPSMSRISWRVRVWTDADEGSTAWTVANFETGPDFAKDWLGAWVRPAQRPTEIERWTIGEWVAGHRPEKSVEDRLRPSQRLRQRFSVAPGLRRARLFATAHGIYRAEINAQRIGDRLFAPGYDSYEHLLAVQGYDVTELLHRGDNVLGVALADGWWVGRIALSGSSAHWGDKLSAVWQLVLDYEGGRREIVASGPDVVSSPGPERYADIFIGEHFDRRLDDPQWSTIDFDDVGWEPVDLSAESLEPLANLAEEPVRRLRELSVRDVRRDPHGGWIVDFGQVIAGRVRIELPEQDRGCPITIEHTETLDSGGGWFVNIDGINKDQTDVYLAAGLPGGESWEPEFTFHGFRYARIRGLAGPPEPGSIVAVVIGSDLAPAGTFHCSDDRLNRLHENVVWSQRGNFLSVPTDCPQRERVGWTGDIQVFTRAATNNMDVFAFLRRWLRNLRADQLPDGRVTVTSPRSPVDADAATNSTGFASIVACAGWSDAIAIVPWALYERYGDARILIENYDAMVAWADFQRQDARDTLPSRLAGRELTHQQRDAQAQLWNGGIHFGDWLTPSTLQGRPLHEGIGIAPRLTAELLGPMYQANTLTILAKTATELGRDDDSIDFAERARIVRSAFASEYLAADGTLLVQLQGPYVVGLEFDMFPERSRPAVQRHLAGLVRDNGDRLDTGFLSVPYLLDVLWGGGSRDLARAVLWQDEQPSWLYEVDRGATTVWESWDAINDDHTVRTVSLNHFARGSVDDWLFRRIGGIAPAEAGYRRILFEPDVDCGLESAEATRRTPYGDVAISWTRSDEAVTISGRVPVGATAELRAAGIVAELSAGDFRREFVPTPTRAVFIERSVA